MRTKDPDLLYISSPRLNQLRLLSILADDPFLTQAVLARRCGLSVAMVNNYMRDLCDAGLIEYRRKSAKTVSYHLTVSGRAQAAAMEAEFTEDAVTRFTQAKERIRKHILRHSPEVPLRRVVLWGRGPLAEIVLPALAQAEIQVIGVCDDAAGGEREWFGCPVLESLDLPGLGPDAVIITDLPRSEEIWRRLRALLKGRVRLIRMDDPSSAARGSGLSENGATFPAA